MPALKDLIDPMPGKIAVQIRTADEITKSGLYIPVETARSQHEQRAVQGTVVAIGEDDDLEEPTLKFKVGDTVVFGKYSGTEISYQPPTEDEANVVHRKPRPPREKIIIMSFKDILAVIKRPEEASNIKVRG